MKLRSKIGALATAATLAAGTGIAQAGPWVDDDPGHGYAQLSYSNYTTTQYFAGIHQLVNPQVNVQDPNQPSIYFAEGSKQDVSVTYKYKGGPTNGQTNPSKYVAQDAVAYAEISLLHHLGFVFSMPLYRSVSQSFTATTLDSNHQVVSNNDVFRQNGPGDMVLGLKYQIPQIRALRGFAFGPQFYLTTQTGNQNARASYPAPITSNPVPLPTGNGTTDLESRLSLGYSFYPIPIFATADIGYHHHFNDAVCNVTGGTQSVQYSDDLPWSVVVGGSYSPHKKYFDHLTVTVAARGIKSFRNGDIPTQSFSPYIAPCGQANNMDMFSLGGGIMLWPIKRLGISYGIDKTLAGVNAGAGLANSVGLATEF